MTAVMTNRHLAWFAGPDSAIPDENWNSGPTFAQLSTLENYSASIKVDGTDFNVEASEQVDDRSFADMAGAQSRGVVQAGGNVEVYTPGRGDTSSHQAQTWDVFSATRSRLALMQRPVKPQAAALAAGDEVNLFRVITDDRQHNRNDASRTVGMGLVLQDDVIINYIVPSSTPSSVEITPSGALEVEIGELLFLKAEYEGRNITVGARYESSDESVFTVTAHGIIVPVGAGTADLLVTYPGAAAATPIEVTVNP